MWGVPARAPSTLRTNTYTRANTHSHSHIWHNLSTQYLHYKLPSTSPRAAVFPHVLCCQLQTLPCRLHQSSLLLPPPPSPSLLPRHMCSPPLSPHLPVPQRDGVCCGVRLLLRWPASYGRAGFNELWCTTGCHMSRHTSGVSHVGTYECVMSLVGRVGFNELWCTTRCHMSCHTHVIYIRRESYMCERKGHIYICRDSHHICDSRHRMSHVMSHSCHIYMSWVTTYIYVIYICHIYMSWIIVTHMSWVILSHTGSENKIKINHTHVATHDIYVTHDTGCHMSCHTHVIYICHELYICHIYMSWIIFTHMSRVILSHSWSEKKMKKNDIFFFPLLHMGRVRLDELWCTIECHVSCHTWNMSRK